MQIRFGAQQQLRFKPGFQPEAKARLQQIFDEQIQSHFDRQHLFESTDDEIVIEIIPRQKPAADETSFDVRVVADTRLFRHMPDSVESSGGAGQTEENRVNLSLPVELIKIGGGAYESLTLKALQDRKFGDHLVGRLVRKALESVALADRALKGLKRSVPYQQEAPRMPLASH